jgi:hypothetical protein
MQSDKLQHSTAAQRPSDLPSRPARDHGSKWLIDFWLRPKAALSAFAPSRSYFCLAGQRHERSL